MNKPSFKKSDSTIHGGWVFYDNECSFCTGLVQKFQNILKKRGFELMPLHTHWAKERLNLFGDQFTEMYVLNSNKKIFRGADAVVYLASKIWWLWVLYALAQIPGVMRVFQRMYRVIAKNRHCRFLNPLK